MSQEFLIDGDHEEMVANWLAECEAKGWDPETGESIAEVDRKFGVEDGYKPGWTEDT